MSKASPAFVGGMVIALLVVGGIAFLVSRDDGGGSGDREYVPVASFSDVHGLAVNPEDPNEIFVATHHGLIRGVVSNGTAVWSRVGGMQDDLMGFSMHPTEGGTFWTSGHPRGGGNMGVRLSTDGGFGWRTTWSERVDFHAMTVSPADPQNLWGYYGGKLYRSTDGGIAWKVANERPPALRALAADPRDIETLYATMQAGVSKSVDGGRTWTTLGTVPALGIAIDPTDSTIMYAGGQDRLWKSTDAGATWNPQQLPRSGTIGYLSVSRSDPNVAYAASYETGIYRTTDGGTTWALIKQPDR